jgi:hypothetical protein
MKKIFFLACIFLLIVSSESMLSKVLSTQNSSETNPALIYPGYSLTSNEELVLNYLKSIQDNFSQNHWLVPAMEDNSGQTFNNALTAMAFILSNEKERAERILDFYATRTDSSNSIINKQNFFFNGQARGFFQNVDLNNSYNPFVCDRWMGDNVWLLFAYKFYEKQYGFSSKPLYTQVTVYIKNLLVDFYIDDPTGHGGFVRHGWRWGPRNSSTPQNDYQLHEFDQQGNPVGHEEGNIDAYAAFKLLGLDEKALKVKEWIDYRMTQLGSSGLPLDLFSWRSLAFCNDGLYYKLLVNVPENDFGFKKVVNFNGKLAVGFFSRDDNTVNNVWLDGTGHMACAFYSSGFADKGDYYSAQLDSFLISRIIGGSISLALPYTANKTGGYDWVDITKGFSSACAWYIFAKHRFNPFTLTIIPPAKVDDEEPVKLNYNLEQNYPNPFNPNTKIRWQSQVSSWQTLKVYDILGNEIITLVDEYKNAGNYEVEFNPESQIGAGSIKNLPAGRQGHASGIYFYQLKVGNFVQTKKMTYLK